MLGLLILLSSSTGGESPQQGASKAHEVRLGEKKDLAGTVM